MMHTLTSLCLVAAWSAVDLQPDPPANDIYRFPPAQLVDDWSRFRRPYLQGLRDRWQWDLAQRPIILETISEVESLWAPWDALADAWRSERYVYNPRPYLGHLRRLLGEERYANGTLPPPYPMGTV